MKEGEKPGKFLLPHGILLLEFGPYRIFMEGNPEGIQNQRPLGIMELSDENNNVLKTKGYHLEHNFCHGKQYLSATMLSLNLLAFLFHTVLEWSDEQYAFLRQVLARRQTFFEDMRALTRYMVFESWHHLMDFMMKGLKLESKLAFKLRPKLDTS